MAERISISQKPGSTSIIIYPFRDRKKELSLSLWVGAWLTGGLIIAGYFFIAAMPKEQRLMLLVWLAFWIYFLWLGGYALLWRKKGFERLLIKDGKLFYRKELFRRGKPQVFDLEAIGEISHHPAEKGSFIQQLTSSYWHVGGETVTFRYYRKRIKLGQQLDLKDQKKLVEILKANVPVSQ